MGNSGLLSRSVVTLLILSSAFLVFLPNIAEQKLEVVFRGYSRDAEGNRIPADQARLDSLMDNPETGLNRFFNAPCIRTEKENPDEGGRCVIHSRFITAARINEMIQSHPEEIDEIRTKLHPHAVETMLSFLSTEDYKNLKIKLGLDLQGGMRATFRADFEEYLSKLAEKYEPVKKDLEAKLSKVTDENEKADLERRLQEINDQLNLTESRKQSILMESKSIIDKRLAAQNLTEPEVRVQPASYSIGVDMPGVANSSEVLEKIKDTLTVEYRLVNNEATDRINRQFFAELEQIRDLYKRDRVDYRDVERILDKVKEEAALSPEEGKLFMYWRRGRKSGTPYLPREFRVLGPVVMDGGDMTNAQENPNPNTGWYDISFVLSGPGAEKFGRLTTENTGKNLAILWGDRVVSDPRINGPIVGGSGVINGDFDRDDAAEIANVIREGALPLPLEIISVSYVGPGLGQDSIVAGVKSVILGFLLVIAVMVLYYQLAGLISVFALFFNLLLMAAVLSLLEFTLTLPGFAGIILTVGMAVDANVIIYEKMREDLRSGKSPLVTIESGFNSSFWTILDANVTTLIAAVILYYNGDGPIQGFAITLFFGLLSSLFTSLYFSKLMFDWLHLPGRGFSKLYIGWNIRSKV